ncbi:hypothetical protein SAMN05216456_0454 [Devosia crocina]|uniref:Uncharacterized protein n=1 Tax=Devosia crocina TaxID=429728 RepID=A0A1I7N0J4_9HYPH|nr:hypothetical protein [Devosia crocina]SFV28171.1 hypothetical protein SAMN05216456_0454 [Devosia crocina]
MIRHIAPVLGFAVLLTGSAMAAPFCDGAFERGHVTMGFSIGKHTDEDRNSFDMMHLRQRGVDATRVERWNGCIRAFVRVPGGGEEMQFFEPGTYRQVY